MLITPQDHDDAEATDTNEGHAPAPTTKASPKENKPAPRVRALRKIAAEIGAPYPALRKDANAGKLRAKRLGDDHFVTDEALADYFAAHDDDADQDAPELERGARVVFYPPSEDAVHEGTVLEVLQDADKLRIGWAGFMGFMNESTVPAEAVQVLTVKHPTND